MLDFKPRRKKGEENKPKETKSAEKTTLKPEKAKIQFDFLNAMSKNQKIVCLSIIGVIVVLVIWLLVSIFLPGFNQDPIASSTASESSQSSTLASEAESFDKDAISRISGEYAGILLEETEDAGDEYVADTVFLGDSNTARMITYSDSTGLTMENTIGIESMGITSVTGLRCVRFSGMSDMTMPSAVALMQPRRVVINFGTNNAGTDYDSFKNSYQTAVEAIQEEWPYADIIIASVIPITSTCSYSNISMKWIESINLTLLELAKEMDVKFLNWSDAIKDTSTGYAKDKFMVSDGIHISESGAEAMIDYFRTHSFEGEDTRPKPLKDVPNRLPTPEGLFPKPVFSVPEETTSQVQSSAVSVTVSGGSGGSASGGGSGTAGSAVNIGVSVTPNAGYQFTGWSASAGSVSGNATSITVSIPEGYTGSINVVANFAQTTPVSSTPVTSTPVTPPVSSTPVTSTPVTPPVSSTPVTSTPVTPPVSSTPVTSTPVTPPVSSTPVTTP